MGRWIGQHKLRSFTVGISMLILADLLYLMFLWPDWDDLAKGKLTKSSMMMNYEDSLENVPKRPPIKWDPKARYFPKRISRVFVVAEDSRFYHHAGIDFEAVKIAMEYNFARGKIVAGASTISQQTAKNLFFSLSRSPLRKFNEVIMTYALESHLEKRRILQIYLNIAEFGTGLYGLEAAARAYYRKSAYHLSRNQAIELAASLPSPKKHNPRTRTKAFYRRKARVARSMNSVYPQKSAPPAVVIIKENDETSEDLPVKEEKKQPHSEPHTPSKRPEKQDSPKVDLTPLRQAPSPLLLPNSGEKYHRSTQQPGVLEKEPGKQESGESIDILDP